MILRNMRGAICALFGLLALSIGAAPAEAQAPSSARASNSSIALVAEAATIAPGQAFSLALRLTPDPGWHAYWINPGDAGLNTRAVWTAPGFTFGELQYPTPGTIPFMGLTSYGYDGEVVLLAEAVAPADLPPTVPVEAKVRWLVCDDATCVPQSATLALTLARGEGAPDPAVASLFAGARRRLPSEAAWPATVATVGADVVVQVALPEDVDPPAAARVFPVSNRLFDHGARQAWSYQNGTLMIVTEAAANPAEPGPSRLLVALTGADGATRAAFVDAAVGATTPLAAAGVRASDAARQSERPAPAAQSSAAILPLFNALILALLGGLVLNLMPCVLPILSLKALSLARSSASEARRDGLLYTTGVLITFLVFAAALIALRSVLAEIGWGFHLQNPLVVVILALIMAGIGLNLLGVFEVGRSVAGTGSDLSAGHGAQASFFTGVLAVVVAAPCTAPFMAAALGYALVQPAPTTVAVFAALGLGFALPFLALSLAPRARGWLPRPGAWMVVFKHALAFPMFLSALWLLWVLGQQGGVNAMGLGALGAVCLGFAAWAFGRSQTAGKPLAWRLAAALGLALTLATAAGVSGVGRPPAAAEAVDETVYSAEALQTALDADRPVFLYFTAAWCITCKVNERVAINTRATRALFEEQGVEVMVGDWTNDDPAITEVLARYGRAGVPLYLYFGPGTGPEDGRELPQLLTPAIVRRAVADGI